MSNSEPFTPMTAGTTTLALSASNQTRVLAKQSVAQTVLVTSLPGTGTAPGYIEFGTSAASASVPSGTTPGSTPILPGAIYTFTLAETVTHFAAIGATGTTLLVTCGHGQ